MRIVLGCSTRTTRKVLTVGPPLVVYWTAVGCVLGHPGSVAKSCAVTPMCTMLASPTHSQSIQSMCSFTLSSDARVVDDEMAIRYMNAFKKFMENPATML